MTRNRLFSVLFIIPFLANNMHNICSIIFSGNLVFNFNRVLFQMFESIRIPGAVEHHATPVHLHSATEHMVMQQRMSENTTNDLETDDEEEIPNLMIEIANRRESKC